MAIYFGDIELRDNKVNCRLSSISGWYWCTSICGGGTYLIHQMELSFLPNGIYKP